MEEMERFWMRLSPEAVESSGTRVVLKSQAPLQHQQIILKVFKALVSRTHIVLV
jgi:hypothetical protein